MRMGERDVEVMRGRGHLKDPPVEGRIILKLVLNM
jgi:hypothetical protein